MTKGSSSLALVSGLAGLLLLGCRSNQCQTLCDAFYRIELRCEQFATQEEYHPKRCAGSTDPQAQRQEAEYKIRTCEQDYLMSSEEEQKACCKSLCFESILSDYDSISGSEEGDYEAHRDLCRKYRQLARDGDAAWCQELRGDCEKLFP